MAADHYKVSQKELYRCPQRAAVGTKAEDDAATNEEAAESAAQLNTYRKHHQYMHDKHHRATE